MSAAALRIGLSTCPNDTFAFHALMQGLVDRRGLALEFVLADIEELNQRFAAGALAASKLSFHAALALSQRCAILECGAALGFGVGPLLLAAPRVQPGREARVLAPGAGTTASLLWKLFHGREGAPEQVEFARILPALERGEAALGVCIHEGRFTYARHGLRLVEDLGQRWERETGCPLPLGGIAVARALPAEQRERLCDSLRDSIEWGLAHAEQCLPSMRAHAQELSEQVLWQHVELYVNQHTLELGELGEQALATLAERARAAGVAVAAPFAIQRGARALDSAAVAPRLFHLAEVARWEAFERSGAAEWRPDSLAREGFAHLSFASQLAGTLRAHFGSARELVLLEVERAGLGAALRVESSRGGALFPHLYRPIARAEFARQWRIRREADAWWSLPLLARTAAGDRSPHSPRAERGSA